MSVGTDTDCFATERCIGCDVVFEVSAEVRTHETDGCSYEPVVGLCDHCHLWASLEPARSEVDIADLD